MADAAGCDAHRKTTLLVQLVMGLYWRLEDTDVALTADAGSTSKYGQPS